MIFKKNIFFLIVFPSALFAGSLDTNSAKTIRAPKIEYNVKNETIKTTGQTEITNASGQKLTLVDSYISQKNSNAYGNDIKMWLGQNTFIVAENILYEEKLSTATNAVFTACYDCDSFGNAWEISATDIKHDMETHLIKFYNPVFWVYNLPIAWFPYLETSDPSVKHKSGLLIPYFNSTNHMGTQFNFPIYISLSDTHDFTFTPSYLTQENPLFQLEHRLNLNHSEFRSNGSFTNNRAGDNRWHIFNKDTIEMGDNVRTRVFLERASDKTYLQRYGFYGDQPYLDSGASVELFGRSGYVVADAHIFQEMRESVGNQMAPGGNILPNIRGVYQSTPLFNETYAVINADVLGISGDDSANQRIIGESKIISPWTLWGGQRITAAASARYDVYNFTNTTMTDGTDFSGIETRFLPSGYLEWGLPMVSPGKNWAQIIEPRARITAMKTIDNAAFALNNDSAGALLSDATLFSNKRFSGLDLWENGTFADYGARWSAFDSNGQNIELFLGQTYDFTKQTDTDPNSGFHYGGSDYVGRIGYKQNDWLEFGSRFRFDRSEFALRHVENDIKIGTARNYLNLGHIWANQFIDAKTLDKDINELSASFSTHLTGRFGLKWGAAYNITDERFQRHMGGLFYEHPCYYMSLEYHRDNAIKADYVGNTTFKFKFGISINGVKQ